MFHQHHRTIIACLLVLQLILAAAATSAQPAPPPPNCTDGQVLNMSGTRCVNPGEDQQGGADDDPPGNEVPPPDPGHIGTLSLQQWVCTSDFEPLAVQDGNGGPANACGVANPPAFPITISAGDAFSYTATLQAPSGEPATLQLPAIDGEPVPAGSLTFTMSPVDGYTLGMIFCEGPNIRSMEPAISNGTSGTIQTLAGMELRCSVYMVSTVAVDKPYRLDLGGGSITIGILSVLCPAGTAVEDDLDRSCTTGASNVPFLVQSETENLAANVTDGNGTLFFEDVKEGNLAVIETVPSGYGQPYVRCTWYSVVSGKIEFPPHILYGSGFKQPLLPGDELECTFYNFLAAGPDNGPSIYIQYNGCGLNSGVENAATLDDAYALPNCYGPVFGIVLSVSFGGTVVTSDSSSAEGQLFFTKLPVADGNSTYTISKDITDHRPIRNAFCDRGPTSGPYDVIPVTVEDNQRFSVDAGVDTLVRCTVYVDDGLFLTPEPGPPGDQITGDGNNVGGNNPNDASNTIDPNQQSSSSGAGQVKLAGPSLTGNNGGDSSANPPANPDAESGGSAGDAAGAPSTVTIQFWICPDGIATGARDEDLLFACTADGTNRDVTTTFDGATNSETIPGYSSWNVAGTAFTLTIAPQSSSAWCSATGTAGSQFPEEVEITDGALGLSINEPGTVIYCDWFTAP